MASLTLRWMALQPCAMLMTCIALPLQELAGALHAGTLAALQLRPDGFIDYLQREAGFRLVSLARSAPVSEDLVSCISGGLMLQSQLDRMLCVWPLMRIRKGLIWLAAAAPIEQRSSNQPDFTNRPCRCRCGNCAHRRTTAAALTAPCTF